jgi:CRP-like cAMP-binding protein
MNRRSRRFAALRATKELGSCSDQELQSLLGYADEVKVAAGTPVAQEGRYCTEFVVVMEGTLSAGTNGSHRRLTTGDSYGWRPMWERSVNDTTLVAETDARLLVMGHEQFRAVKGIAGSG